MPWNKKQKGKKVPLFSTETRRAPSGLADRLQKYCHDPARSYPHPRRPLCSGSCSESVLGLLVGAQNLFSAHTASWSLTRRMVIFSREPESRILAAVCGVDIQARSFLLGLFGSSSSLPFSETYPGCHPWASRSFRGVFIFLLQLPVDAVPKAECYF